MAPTRLVANTDSSCLHLVTWLLCKLFNSICSGVAADALTGCMDAGRQAVPPLQGSSGAVRNTYAGYIQNLQQSGASNGNRLALHAGRRNTVSDFSLLGPLLM